MKKSIEEAKARAKQISLDYPDITVRVMDKPRQRAVVVGVDFMARERVLEGWRTVTTYKNGKEV